MNIAELASICHDANRALCRSHGDLSQPSFDDAPSWQVHSAIDGVRFHLDNPNADASASHENWLAHKRADGWVYGEKKDPDAKTHPCMVPFEDLPEDQQSKDHLFRAIVHALAPFLDSPSDAVAAE